MKFPRNARIFRGQLDAAPFAAVFFILVIFLMLGTRVYTPGVRLKLPIAKDLPGTDKPVVAVAIAKGGQLYFENKEVKPDALRSRLAEIAKKFAEPPTLLVQMDEDVPYKMFLNLTMLAHEAGISEALLATLPAPNAKPVARSRNEK